MMILSCIHLCIYCLTCMSSSGIFGGRGRDLALASATVKGITTNSTREAICVDLDTKTGRNVVGLEESGSLA